MLGPDSVRHTLCTHSAWCCQQQQCKFGAHQQPNLSEPRSLPCDRPLTPHSRLMAKFWSPLVCICGSARSCVKTLRLPNRAYSKKILDKVTFGRLWNKFWYHLRERRSTNRTMATLWLDLWSQTIFFYFGCQVGLWDSKRSLESLKRLKPICLIFFNFIDSYDATLIGGLFETISNFCFSSKSARQQYAR